MTETIYTASLFGGPLNGRKVSVGKEPPERFSTHLAEGYAIYRGDGFQVDERGITVSYLYEYSVPTLAEVGDAMPLPPPQEAIE